MQHDFHVRYTDYLRRINAGRVHGYTGPEDQAAAALWDIEQSELTLREVELDLARDRQEAELKRIWEREPDLHPRKRKAKAAGI